MDLLLKKLISAYGVSGREDEVRSIIKKEISKYTDEIFIDSLGNLIARKKGKKPRVMLAAHMDEIGLAAKHIDKHGKIYFSTIGGIEPVTLLGQRVKALNKKKNSVKGIITTEEMLDGQNIENIPELENMFIDTGFDKDQLRKKSITVGSFFSLMQEEGHLGNDDMIYGKALDDRVGCYILIELAKKLKNSKNEIYYAFTVQEEIGLYGAVTSTYKIEPDWAVAVDVTNSFEKDDARIAGKGPTIMVKDSDMIGNQCIDDWLVDISKKKNLPYQMEVSDVGTTDALNISISKGGVPTASVGVVVKNVHTTVGTASMSDIKNAIKLLYELLKQPHNVCLT